MVYLNVISKDNDVDLFVRMFCLVIYVYIIIVLLDVDLI